MARDSLSVFYTAMYVVFGGHQSGFIHPSCCEGGVVYRREKILLTWCSPFRTELPEKGLGVRDTCQLQHVLRVTRQGWSRGSTRLYLPFHLVPFRSTSSDHLDVLWVPEHPEFYCSSFWPLIILFPDFFFFS